MKNMIPVWDKENTLRLLGYVPKFRLCHGKQVTFPLYYPVRMVDPWDSSFGVRDITLDVMLKAERLDLEEWEGWRHTVHYEYVLVTDAPLEDLRLIRGWCFPGTSGDDEGTL